GPPRVPGGVSGVRAGRAGDGPGGGGGAIPRPAAGGPPYLGRRPGPLVDPRPRPEGPRGGLAGSSAGRGRLGPVAAATAGGAGGAGPGSARTTGPRGGRIDPTAAGAFPPRAPPAPLPGPPRG